MTILIQLINHTKKKSHGFIFISAKRNSHTLFTEPTVFKSVFNFKYLSKIIGPSNLYKTLDTYRTTCFEFFS